MSEATLLRGFESHIAEIGGSALRYFIGGAGPTVVLVHGLGGSATNWSELAPLLARRRRVLALDLPGHGRSAPASIPDLGALADRVLELTESLGLLPAAVVGHSLGGVVALRAAVRRPEAVSAVVLAASSGIGSTLRRARVFLRVSGVVRPSRFVVPFRRRVVASPALRRAVFGYWGAADPAGLSPESALGFLDGAAWATDVGAAGRALLEDDPRLDLHAVRCPTLLLWGTRDRLARPEEGFEYARRLRAPIRMLAGTGHLLIGERPHECAAILDPFLDGVGEVDELPVEAELVGQPRRERADS